MESRVVDEMGPDATSGMQAQAALSVEHVSVEGGIELGVRAWRRTAGPSGAAFVLLHGIASTAIGWNRVAVRLMAAGRDVFAVDFRGHGASSRPDAGYDLTTFASDLAAVVVGLGLERPIVVGHSLGASVILEAVAHRPALASGIGLVEGGLVDARDQFATLEECVARMALPQVAGMPLSRLEGYLRHSNPGWSELRLAAAFAAFDVHPDGTVAWRLSGERYESLLRALWAARSADAWAVIHVPACVVVADTGDSTWTAAKRTAEASMRRALPAARIEWLEADHDVHTDRPDEVAAVLLETFPGS